MSKKLMGQVVFLYFLQKKGWLGVGREQGWGSGPRDFLRRLADGEYGRYDNFYNDVLEPLFYDTLATDRGHEAWCNRFKCRIPFLNGGLFEPPGDYDWRKTDILLPNRLFTNSEAVDEGVVGSGVIDVFDRYNFTVNEAEPLEKEVAIDPEMLGKVFENLIEENRRKGLGAFYTPREIVHYMCQESLINYLDTAVNTRQKSLVPGRPKQGRLFGEPEPEQTALQRVVYEEVVPRADIETFIQLGEQISHYEGVEAKYRVRMPKGIVEHARLMDEKLADITVCDPAVGSGAFPVGMMTEIVRARSTLTPYFNDVHDRTPYHFKRHAIQNCLYGVDIDASAVEIAKLRLWLSLVVDEEDVKQIKPLPNLDYKIVAGNSLRGAEKSLFNDRFIRRLEELKPHYFDESDKKQKDIYKSQIEKTIHELNNGKETFDFEIYFSEVFHKRTGFDVLIANPPYVKEYTDKSAFDGLRDTPYYQGKMDLWYFFACKSLDLLRPDCGVLCFVATNNWVTNSGASILRNKIASDARILKLLDFGSFMIFESASIQTMVLICRKTKTPTSYEFSLGKISEPQAAFADVLDLINGSTSSKFTILTPIFERDRLKNKPFVFSDDSSELVLQKLMHKTNFAFDKKEEVAQGIVAPQDSVNAKAKQILQGRAEVGEGIFVLSMAEKDALRLSRAEIELVKPYYTTNELGKYSGTKENLLWIIYTDSSYKDPSRMAPYPKLKQHLDKFRSVITSSNHPYGLHRARYEYFFRGEKIVSLRKCSVPTFTYTDFDCYVSQTFYVIKSKRINLKYLTGLLNSQLIYFWFRHRGKLQGHQLQIDKEPLLQTPIYVAPTDKQRAVIGLVDKVLAAKKRDPEADTTALEKEIDRLVYKIYDLTPDEIRLVEEGAQK